MKVFIIIYTLYHHTYKLALEIQSGLDEVDGIESYIFQVPETLSNEVLQKMGAPEKPNIPVITVDKLKEADAFLFGIPTRYGNMPAQMKAFCDATGKLWLSGALVGKLAGTFFSTGSQHGGQETTAFTFLTFLSHLGIIYVPLGYTHPLLLDNKQVRGGSPYGAGTITGLDGSRQPSNEELEICKHQGRSFGKIVEKFR